MAKTGKSACFCFILATLWLTKLDFFAMITLVPKLWRYSRCSSYLSPLGGRGREPFTIHTEPGQTQLSLRTIGVSKSQGAFYAARHTQTADAETQIPAMTRDAHRPRWP